MSLKVHLRYSEYFLLLWNRILQANHRVQSSSLITIPSLKTVLKNGSSEFIFSCSLSGEIGSKLNAGLFLILPMDLRSFTAVSYCDFNPFTIIHRSTSLEGDGIFRA